MREWLSGRALPCQGKCRGFESRLPLQKHYCVDVIATFAKMGPLKMWKIFRERRKSI